MNSSFRVVNRKLILVRVSDNNFLTFTYALVALFSICTHANILSHQSFKTHLRWKIFVPKDQILITKYPTYVKIETLNPDIFDQLEKEVRTLDQKTKYISDIRAVKNNFPRKSAKLIVNLRNADIELFSFYKQKDATYILDFWDAKEQEKALNLTSKPKPQNKKKVENQAEPVAKVVPFTPAPAKKEVIENKKEVKKQVVKKTRPKRKESQTFRDFRYGGAFMWDYEPLAPTMAPYVNVSRKTPEFFYPINDRDFNKNDQEGHLQLTVNLFRKKKYGLMYKSIKLFQKKYGESTENEFLDYLKANALLRESKNDDDLSIEKSAINLFINIVERTTQYELKKAILQYLVQYMLDKDDYVQALQYSKNLYLVTKQNFDIELNRQATESILYCLSGLNQAEKIEKFISEKTIQKILPIQRQLAFKSYALLQRGQAEAVIRDFERSNVEKQTSIDSALLFNTAEAYFRLANYKKAIELFDKFTKDYSHLSSSSYSRLRIALSYEITGKDENVVKELYKNSINRAVLGEARMEAKFRYVGVSLARQYKPTAKEKEEIIFLDHGPEEAQYLHNDMKKLLWLVRLRTMINSQNYKEALAYLSSLPLDAMGPAEKRVFDGDGAEIIYGLIQKSYNKGDYAKTVKLWEVFKSKYISKVASDPYLNFIVSNSYLNLRLFKSFDNGLDNFKKISKFSYRQFPLWIERKIEHNPSDLVFELELLRLSQQKKWADALEKVSNIDKNNPKRSYYLAVISDKLGKHKDNINYSEKFLIREGSGYTLSDDEMANFLIAYSNSLYQEGQLNRFKTVTKALLSDIKKSRLKSKFIKEADEKLTYLLSEVLVGEGKDENYLSLEPMISRFLNTHKDSIYIGRMNYLYGLSLANNKKEKQAIGVFNDLLSNTTIPNYLKELARTEISSLKLKNRNI